MKQAIYTKCVSESLQIVCKWMDFRAMLLTVFDHVTAHFSLFSIVFQTAGTRGAEGVTKKLLAENELANSKFLRKVTK